MSGIPSEIIDPRVEGSVGASEERLEQLLRRQRVLSWILSISTLAITVAFFAAMTLTGPLLSRVVFGRSITLATVAAALIILLYLAAIAFFGRQADRIDEQRHALGSKG
jgi:uncharacterized membrane protein (DUF485 family)